MTAKQAMTILEQMLKEAGVDYARPNAHQVWSIFKTFGRIEAGVQAKQDDALLFQCDLANTTKTSRVLCLVFCRRFTGSVVDDDYNTEQVGCMLSFESEEALRKLEANRQPVDLLSLWSFDFASLDAFYAGVEDLPEFELAMSRQEPVWATVYWSGD